MQRIGGFEKLTFFETTKFQYSKFKKTKVFFASFLFKYLINSWVSWIGFNFYDYSDFQQKVRGGQTYDQHCICQSFCEQKINIGPPYLLESPQLDVQNQHEKCENLMCSTPLSHNFELKVISSAPASPVKAVTSFSFVDQGACREIRMRTIACAVKRCFDSARSNLSSTYMGSTNRFNY